MNDPPSRAPLPYTYLYHAGGGGYLPSTLPYYAEGWATFINTSADGDRPCWVLLGEGGSSVLSHRQRRSLQNWHI